MSEIQSRPSGTVAWYKLADLIARKERVKALSVFRLLSHSYNDKAFVLQVEADILLAFNDDQANKRYEQAAYLYKKEKRFVHAVAVGEHLLTLQPDNFEQFCKVIDLYVLLDWKDNVQQKLTEAMKRLDEKTFSDDQCFSLFEVLLKRIPAYEQYAEKKWLKQMITDCVAELPTILSARVNERLDLLK